VSKQAERSGAEQTSLRGAHSIRISRRQSFGGVIRREMLVQARSFYVYILASRSGTLYIGVTNDIPRRMYEHRHHLVPGFTGIYKIHRLVYVEHFDRPDEAIAREKQLKGWTRQRKIALIESVNPRLKNLSSDWSRE
jgi:putative endonuclease